MAAGTRPSGIDSRTPEPRAYRGDTSTRANENVCPQECDRGPSSADHTKSLRTTGCHYPDAKAILGRSKAAPATVKLVIMGIFLAIEGPKGTGKTTVAAAIRQRISGAHDGQVVLTKEPTPGFDLGQESHLLGADLARSIAEDRAAHVEGVIRPALDAGRAVVCDRYILSSLAFHTADGVTPEEIWRLNDPFPFPDVNLILTASARIISSRRALRPSRTRLEARAADKVVSAVQRVGSRRSRARSRPLSYSASRMVAAMPVRPC